MGLQVDYAEDAFELELNIFRPSIALQCKNCTSDMALDSAVFKSRLAAGSSGPAFTCLYVINIESRHSASSQTLLTIEACPVKLILIRRHYTAEYS